jgi:hypothetical protein
VIRRKKTPRFHEPIILPLWPQGKFDPPPDDPKPQGPEHDEHEPEIYWAGRNHAMRISSRIAA